MNNLIYKVAVGISSVLILVSSWIHPLPKSVEPQKLGTYVPVQAQSFYLSGSGITATVTSIGLTAFKYSDASTTITMADFSTGIGYATVEPGSKKEEQVSFTGITQNSDGTATLTGVTRGLNFKSPCSANTNLQLAHAGGVKFVLANTSCFYSQFAATAATNTISAVWTYNASSAPRYDSSPNFTGSSTTLIPDINYVNNVATSGAANASALVKGLVQLSTATNSVSGTGSGSTGALLVPPNSLFNATSSATTTIPVTQPNASGGLYGLSPGFIDQTATYSWSGSHTFSGNVSNTGSTTLASTTVTGQTTFGGAVAFNSIITSGTVSTSIVQLGQTVLASASNTVTVANLPNRQYYWFDFWTPGQSASIANVYMYFNSDIGANYNTRFSQNFTGTSAAGDTGVKVIPGLVNATTSLVARGNVQNFANNPHMVISLGEIASSSSTGLPDVFQTYSVYTSTTAINAISMLASGGASGNFKASSTLTIWGSPQ